MAKAPTSEDTAIEALRALIKKWGPILAIGGSAVGIYYEHNSGIEKLSDSLTTLRADCDARELRSAAIRSFGPDGFSDPQVRAAVDGHIRAFLRGYVSDTDRRCHEWQRRFCELNPTIKCPGE